MRDTLKTQGKRTLIALVIGLAMIGLLVVAGVALDEVTTSPWDASEDVTFDANDGPQVHLQTDMVIDRQHPMRDGVVDLRPEIKFESSGDTSLEYHGQQDGFVTVEDLDVETELTATHEEASQVAISGDLDRFAYQDIDFESTDTDIRYAGGQVDVTVEHDQAIVALDSSGNTLGIFQTDEDHVEISLEDNGDSWTDVTLVNAEEPIVDRDSASPVGPQDQFVDEFEVDIEDPDGGELDVTYFVNGEEEGSQTVQEDGTVSFTSDAAESGENEWEVVVVDEAGNEVTETFEFGLPSEMEIRDEVTDELIDDAEEVEITFFADGEEDIVETREAEDGIVDMEGLPATQSFVVSASADGYITRTTWIDSIIDQQQVYLLDENEDSVLITFDLDDRTEQFPDSETRLVVERAIGTGDETEYRSVAGEFFGADGEQSIELERGQRYRLVVENRDGDRRSLGDFTPETDDFVTLDIGQVAISPDADEGYVFNAKSQSTDQEGVREAVIEFDDPDGNVELLEYRIYERGDEDNTLQDWVSITDPGEVVDRIIYDSDGPDWIVEYRVTIDGEVRENTINIGGIDELNWPLSSAWLHAFGLFAIVGTAAFFGGSMSRVGGVVVSILGFGLTILGVLNIPYVALITAGMVSVVFLLGDNSNEVMP